MIKVLIVDDEPALLELSRAYMGREPGIELELVGSGEEVLEMLENTEFNAIVSDYQMPGMDGIQLLENLRVRGNRTPFILFTGKGREEVAIDALNRGADFYLKKGGDSKSQFVELTNMIRQAVSRREAEDALEHNARRFRSLIENSSDIVCLLNERGEFQYVSPSVSRIFGYDREEPLGAHLSAVIHPDDMPLVDSILEEANREMGFTKNVKCRVGSKNGEWKTVEANLVSDPDSVHRQYILNARDVTERDRIEDELKSERERYRTVFENTGTATLLIEGDTTISLVNDEVVRISGFSKKEIEGRMSFLDFIVEEDRSRLDRYHHLRREGLTLAPLKYESSVIVNGGERRDCQMLVTMIPGSDQSIAFVTDVTEYRRMKHEIDARREEFSQILDSIDVQMWYATDPETFGIMNRARLDFLGLGEGEGDGKKLWEIHKKEEDWKGCLQTNLKAFEGNKVVGEEWVKNASGRLTSQLVSKTPLFDGNGNVNRIFCTAVDITEMKTIEDVLRITNEKMNVMVSITRHDTLNQLAVMGGYLDLLAEDCKNVDPKYIQRIRDAMGRVERHLQFTREMEDLGKEPASWRRASELVCRAMGELDIGTIDLILDEDLDNIQIFSDPMLWKVFYNLAHNTLVHAEGASRISIYPEVEDGATNIIYEDDGPGMPDDVRSLLRGGKGIESKGYGLYLVREILNLNMMDISEEGRLGEGARFRITIPERRCTRA